MTVTNTLACVFKYFMQAYTVVRCSDEFLKFVLTPLQSKLTQIH